MNLQRFDRLAGQAFGPLFLTLVGACVAARVFAVTWAMSLAISVSVIAMVIALPRLRIATWIGLAISAVLTAVAFLDAAGGMTVFRKALENGVFIAALMIVLSLLRTASESSPGFVRCGAMLVSRPPGQRYAFLSVGSMLFSMILNFGSIALLAPMAREAVVRHGQGGVAGGSRMERQMFMAIMRGFSACLITSPTSISVIVILAAYPELDLGTFLPATVGTALLVLALGWLIEQTISRRDRRNAAPTGAGDYAALLPALAILVATFASTALVSVVLRVRIPDAVMVAVPLVSLGWIAVQSAAGGGDIAGRLARRLRHELRFGFEGMADQTIFVFFLGFISSAMASLIGAHAPSGGLLDIGLHPNLFIGMIMVLVVASGQLGFNPLVMVSALIGILPPAAAVGVSPSVLALTLLCAWSMSAGASPGVASLHLLASIARRGAFEVAYRWNGAFTIAVALTLYLYLVFLNRIGF